MRIEKINSKRGTPLRKNKSNELTISIKQRTLDEILIINGSKLLTENIIKTNLIIPPNGYYMVINNSSKNALEIQYDQDISIHQIIYNPYLYEKSKKNILRAEDIISQFKIPKGYIDVLPKWYSFKFTYPDYSLIFIKPKLGISFQLHDNRSEIWEILKGKPILVIGNRVYYDVENEMEFEIPKNTIHSVINPNFEEFIILRESWTGIFDEKDIYRIFNPNNYE